MYTTCLFCHGGLGRNEIVEEFSVGRRIAFDPTRGRLWALCRRCRQWNLSPIESRWEALEALERLYHDTPTRYSTGEIGIMRHPSGIEVVRIGRPELPEYASWRYGRELLRRRRRVLYLTAPAVIAGVYVGGTVAAVAGTIGLVAARAGFGLYRALRDSARVALPDGGEGLLLRHQVREVHLADPGCGWQLRFQYVPVTSGSVLASMAGQVAEAALEGETAIRAAGRILPALNRAGGSTRLVRDATRFVEDTGTADDAFRRAMTTRTDPWRDARAPATAPARALYRLPTPVRLGLEMIAQETTEQRALEGEIARLEREWRAAEEVAAIADDLLIPDSIRKRIRPKA